MRRKAKNTDIETEGVATTAPCHALTAADGASPSKGWSTVPERVLIQHLQLPATSPESSLLAVVLDIVTCNSNTDNT